MTTAIDSIRELLAHMGVPAEVQVDSANENLIIIETDQFSDDGFNILETHDAVLERIWHIEVEALIDLVAADAREIKALVVIEHVFDQGLGIIDSSQVAGA